MSESTERRLFTDEQVMEACGITQDNLRKLITWRAVTPAQAGGGRGRIRLWTSRQINRICVTEQFRSSGFSLRMAHTLAYALPLDDMLALYDLDYVLSSEKQQNDPSVKEILKPGDYQVEGNTDRIGHVVIVNNCDVYTDALGDEPVLFGYLDWDKNVFVSQRRIDQFYWGPVLSSSGKYPEHLEVGDIDRSSLLVRELNYDDPFWKEYYKTHESQLYVPYQYGWSTLVIRLYMGLEYAVRKLLALPVMA